MLLFSSTVIISTSPSPSISPAATAINPVLSAREPCSWDPDAPNLPIKLFFPSAPAKPYV